MAIGIFICRTQVALGMPLKYIRTGKCGVKPASATTCTPCTASAISADTTKKSLTLPLQVAALGAQMTPPTFRSQFVALSSSGVQFQSPPKIHGPLSVLRVKATDSRVLRFSLAWVVRFGTPSVIQVSLRYSDPKLTPPLPITAAFFIMKRPSG